MSQVTKSRSDGTSALWPLFLAPFVAVLYYLALRNAFAVSISRVVFDASDVNFFDAASPTWGTHWIYRIVAEAASLAFGTFVAGGIAQRRESLGAIIGALGISILYFARIAGVLYVRRFAKWEGYEAIEPWYQYVIDGAIIFSAPFVGVAMSAPAAELNGPNPVGFGGINRLHFLWLWLAAGMYATGIISPLLNLWLHGFLESSKPLSNFMIMWSMALPSRSSASRSFGASSRLRVKARPTGPVP